MSTEMVCKTCENETRDYYWVRGKVVCRECYENSVRRETQMHSPGHECRQLVDDSRWARVYRAGREVTE